MIRRNIFGPLSVALGLLVVLGAWPEVAVGPEPPALPGMGGALRVTLDPSTGRPIPNPSASPLLTKEWRRALSRSGEGLVQRPHPSGGWVVDLEGRFLSVTLARTDEGGLVRQRCVENEAEARAFLEEDDRRARGLR